MFNPESLKKFEAWIAYIEKELCNIETFGQADIGDEIAHELRFSMRSARCRSRRRLKDLKKCLVCRGLIEPETPGIYFRPAPVDIPANVDTVTYGDLQEKVVYTRTLLADMAGFRVKRGSPVEKMQHEVSALVDRISRYPILTDAGVVISDYCKLVYLTTELVTALWENHKGRKGGDDLRPGADGLEDAVWRSNYT